MKTLSLMLAALAFGGCATYGKWEPVVDPRASRASRDIIDRDLRECRELALKASQGAAARGARGAAVGAGVGAAAGAVLGALSGEAGRGAGVGAALGGVGTGLTETLSAEEEFKQSYRRCMTGRGHHLLN